MIYSTLSFVNESLIYRTPVLSEEKDEFYLFLKIDWMNRIQCSSV